MADLDVWGGSVQPYAFFGGGDLKNINWWLLQNDQWVDGLHTYEGKSTRIASSVGIERTPDSASVFHMSSGDCLFMSGNRVLKRVCDAHWMEPFPGQTIRLNEGLQETFSAVPDTDIHKEVPAEMTPAWYLTILQRWMWYRMVRMPSL